MVRPFGVYSHAKARARTRSRCDLFEAREYNTRFGGAFLRVELWESVMEEERQIVVVMVGAPGSGKSTFFETVARAGKRPWIRVCQYTINNGKAGTKAQCIASVLVALKEGKSVFIDHCNLEREQRKEFVKIGVPGVDVHTVVLDLPAQLCISRSVKRMGHEGNLQGGKAAAVVNRMLQKKELPKLSEWFSRITYCRNDNEVRDALASIRISVQRAIFRRVILGRRARMPKFKLV